MDGGCLGPETRRWGPGPGLLSVPTGQCGTAKPQASLCRLHTEATCVPGRRPLLSESKAELQALEPTETDRGRSVPQKDAKVK